MRTDLKGGAEVEEIMEGGLNVRDGLYGEVTGSCGKGVFLTLDNGEEAFAYFGGLAPGTRVFCTVRRLAAEGLRTLVKIDAVAWEEQAAA